MPQMAPMSWTMLFMSFLISLMLITMMNYYSQNFKVMKNSDKTMIMKSMIWQW